MIAPYERDPARIYAESFRRIRAEAALDGLPEEMRDVAIRLIHASGMTDLVADLRWSAGAVSEGRRALATGAAVICDTEMGARGIMPRGLVGRSPVVTLNDPRVPDLALRLGTTRAAASVDLWEDRLAGAVVAIGNAPTALFRLLERIGNGGPRPALILGFPVGFVGAAESKAALAECAHGVPFVALAGRRGGSAMAAASVNALTLGLGGASA